MRKQSLFVKIMAIVALVAFVFVSLISAFPAMIANAETAQEKIDSSLKKQKEIKDQITEAEGRKQSALEVYNEIDKDVTTLQAKVDSINADVISSQTKIDEKDEELQKAKEECDRQYEDYCERARVLLQKGTVSYLEILINSTSFADFITRISLVKEISAYDNAKLNELKEYAAEIEELKKELEAENKRLVGLKDEADTQMAALKSKQEESKKVLDEIMADIAQYEKALKAQEAAEAAAREEIRRLTMPSNSSPQTVYTGGKFAWPSTSSYITSPYGTRTHPVTGQVKTHTGLDIGAAMGTNIFAAAEGTVLVAGWNAGGYGNYVVIDHGGGLTTLYAHCSSLNVSAGQKVSRGQVIAKCGSTGMSTGPHLHFEVLQNGAHTNPSAYLN